jgi:putative transposase
MVASCTSDRRIRNRPSGVVMTRFEVPDGWVAQAYRFALDPTPAQVTMLESHCGAARFAFNDMLGVVKAKLDQQCAFVVIVAAKTRPAHAGRSQHRVVGVDVGVKELLVVATPDGMEVDRIPAPKPLTRAQSRLQSAQRRAARRCGPYDPDTQTRREPSKRWRRATARVRRIHARVAAIRAQEIHKATTDLAMRHEVVAVEALSVKNMSRRGGRRKRGLNRAIGDAALGRIRAQLDYKTTWYGTELVTAPRFFASTQLCSRCGVKTKLRLRDRIYRCRNGCPEIDRDLNAAINLARLGDPHSGTGTGTGSRPAASVTAGDGRGAIQKTGPTTTSGAVGTAGGDEASTPHTADPAGAGTAPPQGEAA